MSEGGALSGCLRVVFISMNTLTMLIVAVWSAITTDVGRLRLLAWLCAAGIVVGQSLILAGVTSALTLAAKKLAAK